MQTKTDYRIKTNQYPELIKQFKGMEIEVFKGRKYPIGSRHIVKDIDYYDVYSGNFCVKSIIYFVCTDGAKIDSCNCIWGSDLYIENDWTDDIYLNQYS